MALLLSYPPRPCCVQGIHNPFQLTALGAPVLVNVQLSNQRYWHTFFFLCAFTQRDGRSLLCWVEQRAVCGETLPAPKMGTCFVLGDHLLAKSSCVAQYRRFSCQKQAAACHGAGCVWPVLQTCRCGCHTSAAHDQTL